MVYVPNSSNQFVAGFAVANAYPAYRCDVTRLLLSAVFIAAVIIVFAVGVCACTLALSLMILPSSPSLLLLSVASTHALQRCLGLLPPLLSSSSLFLLLCVASDVDLPLAATPDSLRVSH